MAGPPSYGTGIPHYTCSVAEADLSMTRYDFYTLVRRYGPFDWDQLFRLPDDLVKVTEYLNAICLQQQQQHVVTTLGVSHYETPRVPLIGIESPHNYSSTLTPDLPSTLPMLDAANATATACTSTPLEDATKTLPKPQAKHIYYCTTGNCKDRSSMGTLKSYERHEDGHWTRYPCNICHRQERDKILQYLNCRCSEAERHDFVYHLENHRLEAKRCSKDAIRLYNRRNELQKHIAESHHKPPLEADALVEKWAVQIKRVTACGICAVAPAFKNSQDALLHMWHEHWTQGHKLPLQYDELVVNKLLGWNTDVLAIVNADVEQNHPFISAPVLCWRSEGIQKVRMELESNRLAAGDLAKLVLQNATPREFCSSDLLHQATNFLLPSFNPFCTTDREFHSQNLRAVLSSSNQIGPAPVGSMYLR